ncbi:MAG: GAF domain-containing protein [Coriobacteriia bacterium]|jgi:hypothetical protein|nr:GAF domain-containing protein [Coriobacteriia bacterium]
MEILRPHDDAHGPDAFGSGAGEVLRALASLVADSPADKDLATRAVDRVVDLMRLSAATLSSVHENEGGLQLGTVASVGAHAAFTRDMSARPLELLADVAKVVEEGHSIFLADEHHAASTTPPVTGVARWRSNVSRRATGVLPVRAQGETLGVLTVEWPHSQPASQDERDILEAAAAILGTILHEMREAAQSPDRSLPADEVASAAAGKADEALPAAPLVETAIKGVMRSGAVVTLPEVIPSHITPVALISMATRRGSAAEMPFTEVAASPGDACRLAAAVVTTPGDVADASAGVVREALGDLANQAIGPAEALGYLEHTVEPAKPGDRRVSATLCSLKIADGQGVCVLSAAGAGMWVLSSRDGRVSAHSADRAALGSGVTQSVEDRYELLLAGDRLVLLCGPVGSPDAVQRAVRETLEQRTTSAIEIAHTLLDTIADEARSVSVIVVEVGGSD